MCGGRFEPIELYASNVRLSAKFYRPGRAFASRIPVAALACVDCGHVLTFLTDRGPLQQPK